VIACLSIPGLELQAALRRTPALALRPAALAPEAGAEPLLGPVTRAAEAAGVRPGMRLGEALATCPGLALVEPDPAAAETAWEEVVRSLEDAGFSVEAAALGVAYFETRGVERLYGGLEPALRRALSAVGTGWEARVGAAGRRFAALAAASVAKPRHVLVVREDEMERFLAPLPLTLLPLERQRYEELEALGVRRLGQLAGLPGGAVAERLGPDGRRAWSLARGGAAARVRGRRPPAEVAESLEFPEAVGNELTLRRALGALVETVLARPERRDRFVRKVALAARLVWTGSVVGEADDARPEHRAPAAPRAGGSWRRTLTLREPSADADRIRIALGPKLAELPAPVVELRVELVELTAPAGQQLELYAAGAEDRTRLREGLRQVRASTGSGSVCTVMEVAPWSRIPEARALLVPRNE
jgi:nucleotidyltransferase/DNA polymerase involved in DNA repair